MGEKNGKDRSLYFYVIMEKCEGDLYKLFLHPTDASTATEELMILFLKEVSSAIKYLDEKRYFHRDIKPNNILYGTDENGIDYFKICDFGFIREACHTISSVKGFHGTAPYMSPECVNGTQRSTKSDLWAIGITMYTLIMNKLPFENHLSEKQIVFRIAKFEDSPDKHPQLPPNNIISNSLTNLVNELLIVDPAKRISLDDFLDRLESCNTIADDEARKRTIARLVIKLKKI